MTKPNRTNVPDPTPSASEADSVRTTGPGSYTGGVRLESTEFGGYRLLEEIGQGGMGVVYSARDLALDREVAVKVLQDRYAAESPTAERFVEEARITGQLQHPGIPAVYQVGSLPDSRPFLAMKLIKGQTLDDLLKENASIDHLAIFEAISQAVGYAHAHGVIHRDLKPANVMVGRFGEVQVMDWGLAKVLGSREAVRPGDDPEATTAHTEIRTQRDSETPFTQYGSVLGTPAYMAPEQAAGELDKVDTRSDVFGLGALLCVLLTGQPPFTGKDADAVRIAAMRGKTEEALARFETCDADPDVIDLCKRCLAFEPVDRPATGNEVAKAVAELRHAADNRAKEAEREKLSAEVKAAEQAKRRRAVQWAGGAVAAILLLGIAGTTWGMIRSEQQRQKAETAREAETRQRKEAEDQRDRATRAEADANAAGKIASVEAAVAKAINEFLNEDLLGRADPYEEPDRDIKLRTVLDRAAEKIPNRFPDQPLVEAAIRRTIGDTYAAMSEYQAAEKHLDRAIVVYRQERGEDHPDTLRALHSRADLHQLQDQFKQSKPLYDRILAARRRILGADDLDTIDSMHALGSWHLDQYQYELAEPYLTRVVAVRKRILGGRDADTLGAMQELGYLYRALNKHQEAEQLLLRVREVAGATFGPDHSLTLHSTSMLGWHYLGRKKYDQAEPLLTQTVEDVTRVYGPDHKETFTVLRNLAKLYSLQGKYDLAEPLAQRALEGRRRVLGNDHTQTWESMEGFARVLEGLGKTERAEELFREAFETRRRVGGDADRRTAIARRYLAGFYGRKGDHSSAIKLQRNWLQACIEQFGPDAPETMAAMTDLASAYRAAGQQTERITLLEQVLAARVKSLGETHPTTLNTLNTLGVACWRAARFDKSVPLFERLLRSRRETSGEGHPDTLLALANLGVNYKDAGRIEEAIPFLEEAYQASREMPALSWVGSPLFNGYIKAGRREEATELVPELLAAARKSLPAGSPQLAGRLASLGQTLVEIGSYAEAEPLVRECLQIRGKVQPDVWSTFNAQSLLGGALLGQEKYADAEPHLLAGYEGMKVREESIPPGGRDRISESLDRLIALYNALGKPAEVKKYRKLRAEYPPPPQLKREE